MKRSSAASSHVIDEFVSFYARITRPSLFESHAEMYWTATFHISENNPTKTTINENE